jgi:putative PEP-CTERM system integral membrane protein
MDENLEKKSGRAAWLERQQLTLFWSWNLIFLAFMSLGFAPIMLPETFIAVRTGAIPISFLVYALVLAFIPVLAVILGLTVLRRSPSRLFALGYVIEGPLMLILAVRFFAIRQASPGMNLILSVALAGMAAFLWTLLDPRSGHRSPAVEFLRLAGLTLMALTSLYAAAWIAFYALPLGVEGVRAVFNFLLDLPRNLGAIARDLWRMLTDTPLLLPFSILSVILLLYTATLFVITPIAVPFLSLRAWWVAFKLQSSRWRWPGPALVAGAVVAVIAVSFFLVNRQPQARAFALLEKPPASTEEARSLLERADTIRAGLLNAYLAPFRYISAQGGVRHVSDIYASTFRIRRENAFTVQRLYERLASPLLYQPARGVGPLYRGDNQALIEEPQEAARLYQSFFDTPIAEGERETIVRAVRSTWSPDQAESAWQAVDDREVHLVSQELTLQEQGDWAEVELYEVYQNQTAEQQEVIYYFNLPESAVLTGVWLGSSPNKEAADRFQIAPRGAAQAVYREQTRVMQDPALLEQIGPRQYRLRVFPILPVSMFSNDQGFTTQVQEAPQMYMWLSWRQMAVGDGWPMPQMAFLRNVYWDSATERQVNGQTLDPAQEDWLPEALPVSAPVEPQVHQVDLEGGQTVLAIPAGQAERPGLPDGLRMAIVVDRSASMQAYAEIVAETLRQLKTMQTLEQPVDVYLTASPYRGEEASVAALDSLDPEEILYFGGQNAAQLIAQFDSLHGANRSEREYDAVVVLTDGSGYELGVSDIEMEVPPCPVWVVHVSGELPLGYDDQTLETIQASGGGVAGSLDEAMERLAVGLHRAPVEDSTAAPVLDIVDGYVWVVLPDEQAGQAIPAGAQIQLHPADDPFAALAARRLVLAEMQRRKGTINQVETLDELHALAIRYGIVTPYSSMIVLVTSQQQKLLDELSRLEDRYQREVEELGDTTPSAPLPLAGVPEPHEWLLIGLATALLIYLAVKKRTQPLPV